MTAQPISDTTGHQSAHEGPQVDSARSAALVHLRAVKASNGGRIPGPEMDEVAEHLGVGVPHLRRMLRRFEANGSVPHRPPGSPHKVALPDEWRAQVLYFVHRGCARATFDALKKAGDLPASMCLRTFQRRVNEWDPALRACAKGGYRAMVKHQFFNVEHIPHRGYAFGTDHTALAIQVVPERGSKPRWPWLTTLIDLKTRAVLAYLLTLHTPNTEDSLNTLIEGIHGWYTEDGMFVGGKPEFIRSDRGGDYVSKALSLNLLNLDVERQFTEPYSSWQNGRVEALNGTIDRDFAPSVPGFYPGGEAEYTRRVFKTPLDVRSLLTLETLDRRIGDFFGEYNNRPHSSLNGMTPLEAWAADNHPITTADRGTLLHAMSQRDTRRLNKYGIEIRGTTYSHPTLATLRERGVGHVEVRYHEHEKHRIEVFVEGVHECTATKTSVQPEHQRLGVLSVRAKQRRQAEALMRAADYERVLVERERLREEGVDEAEWPELPDQPVDPNSAANDGTTESASVYPSDAALGGDQPDRLGHSLAGQPSAAAVDWLSRMDAYENTDASETNDNPHAEEGAA